MDRPTRILTTKTFDEDCRYMWMYLYEWKDLISKCYKNRSEAYEAIDKFIKKYKKHPLYKKRYKLSNDCFALQDAEKYFQEGFDNKDEYLDYCAYIN